MSNSLQLICVFNFQILNLVNENFNFVTNRSSIVALDKSGVTYRMGVVKQFGPKGTCKLKGMGRKLLEGVRKKWLFCEDQIQTWPLSPKILDEQL